VITLTRWPCLSHGTRQPRCVTGTGDFRPIVDPGQTEGAPSECASLPFKVLQRARRRPSPGAWPVKCIVNGSSAHEKTNRAADHCVRRRWLPLRTCEIRARTALISRVYHPGSAFSPVDSCSHRQPGPADEPDEREVESRWWPGRRPRGRPATRNMRRPLPTAATP